MPKLVITRKIQPPAMELITSLHAEVVLWEGEGPAPRDWVLENVKGATGLLCMLTDKIDEEILLAAGPSLTTISTYSVGYDHLSLPAIRSRSIRIGYTPDVLTDAVADLTVMLVLMAMRRAGEAMRAVDEGQWPNMAWSPTLLTGPQIAHKTLAFLGFGRISHSVLLRLLPFSPSPRVIYHTRTRPSSSELSSLSQGFSTAAGPGRKIEVEWVDLETLAKEGDIVLVLCAGGDATRGLVGEDFMRKMGQGKSKGQGVIVNAARGSIVDSDALAKALKEGWIMGAGLDVVDGEPNVGKEHPLVRESRCVVLPHLGSATAETREGMAMLAAENLVRGVKGEEMRVELKG